MINYGSKAIINEDKSYRILLFGSLPLAAPWNGADKNLGRLFAGDVGHEFIVQSGEQDVWPHQQVRVVRVKDPAMMPTLLQKLSAFAFLLRYSFHADMVHMVVSLKRPSRLSVLFMQLWKRLVNCPVLHTAPAIGDGNINPRAFIGDATVVISQHSKQRLQAAGVKNVYHVRPPLPTEHLHPQTDPAIMRAEHNFGNRAVLYPCHYGDRSGIEEMLRAFAQLPATVADAVLVLACRTHVGQDAAAEAQAVWQRAHELGIADRVRLLSKVTDMPALIQACALTALVPYQMSSKMDLPMVVLESMWLERPFIISDIAPMNELLLGACGQAVTPGDVAGLTDALHTLLANDDLRQEYGRQARKLVRKQFKPKKILGYYQEIYHQLMEQEK